MVRIVWFCLIGLCCWLCSCSVGLPPDVAAAYRELPDRIDYNQHVKPVLSDKCFSCHGPDKAKQKAGLRLDQASSAFEELPESPGKYAIVRGDPESSELYHRILSADPRYVMPTPGSHQSLSAREKAILVKWMEQGAEYKPHWAFVAPRLPEVPVPDHPQWTAYNAIDSFIQQRLETEKMTPEPEAPRDLLLRRLSLDLTGLPPTMQEMDDFLKDSSPRAYEKQVDRLLASAHYGEKMAVDWLDLARFADSHGYTVDRLRDMSPYRDWVIGAFNQNLPYDQFVQWQLAGDLMPHPSREMIIATAFNRNHPQNMEGGVIEEEFQTEYVIDRTNTFGNAFLGLSLGCARCHDHKYDPVSQKNYYELFSFFNNVKEAGQISWDDATPTPTLMLPTPQKEKLMAYFKAAIAAQEQKKVQSAAASEPGFQKWLSSGSYKTLVTENIPRSGLLARYNLEKGSLQNEVAPRQTARMKREIGEIKEALVFEKGEQGRALSLNGDVWLDLSPVGVFRKSDPFSISVRVYIPASLKEGVIFHKSDAERLYNFRGYQLYLRNDRLELNMAHTGPSNAITRISAPGIPRDRWIQLTATYDGSARAAGFRLFLDGREMSMETTMDQLTKDILFAGVDKQPALQVGAWYRGLGMKGGKLEEVLVYGRALTPFEVRVLSRNASWSSLALTPRDKLSTEELDILRQYYLSALSPEIRESEKQLAQLRQTLADSTENIEELMVMQEMPVPKKAHILLRGNYDAPGEQVFMGTPPAVLPFPDSLPKNRYGLAHWLTLDNNPLTSRVAVNRLWQNFFGQGLVKTTEDFGNQGEMPSHPELLDWLAVTFRQSGWNIKQLNKLIVMSATYRQDSRASQQARERDPENRLLSHGPSGRLTAEMIRDNALLASGLLNEAIGGKSFKPYQPDGLWEINNASYKADSGEALYRRSLYILIKRSVPNPTLATFDAGSRSYCLARRQKTNTPLQALVTLNDPTFVEASRALGCQMARTADAREAIRDCYRRLTGRSPSDKELELLIGLRDMEWNKFKATPAKARGWLTTGQFRADSHSDSLLVAANAVVASTIINSDATLTKR